MPLHPASYRCDTHDLDLTDAVLAVLGDETLVSSFTTVPASRRPGPAPDDQPFSIVVDCPGTGPGDGHKLVFDGTRRRA